MIATMEARSTGVFLGTEQCDRCTARARWLVTLRNGGRLVFCEHHTRAYRAALEPVALRLDHDTQPL